MSDVSTLDSMLEASEAATCGREADRVDFGRSHDPIATFVVLYAKHVPDDCIATEPERVPRPRRR